MMPEGEIVAGAKAPVGMTIFLEHSQHLLPSDRSPLRHPERTRGTCSSAGLFWKCFSTERNLELALSEVEAGSAILRSVLENIFRGSGLGFGGPEGRPHRFPNIVQAPEARHTFTQPESVLYLKNTSRPCVSAVPIGFVARIYLGKPRPASAIV
jgi:hypothetical protein